MSDGRGVVCLLMAHPEFTQGVWRERAFRATPREVGEITTETLQDQVRQFRRRRNTWGCLSSAGDVFQEDEVGKR